MCEEKKCECGGCDCDNDIPYGVLLLRNVTRAQWDDAMKRYVEAGGSLSDFRRIPIVFCKERGLLSPSVEFLEIGIE
jgi:hypothetical protein